MSLQIKIWFQNRRARERREKSTIIAPPQGVTLPPTTISSNFPSNPWISQTNFAIRNDQVTFNAHTFSGFHRSCEVDKISPKSLTPQRYTPISESNHSQKPIYGSTETNDKDTSRPGTPLDIETVDN